jgi:SAM-dependent methyltransferase
VLAPYFSEVVATDASPEQIAAATPCDRVRYAVAPAECSGLEDASIDLVTVAQALHWLDHARFYAEVRRVARPGGVLAAWSYTLANVRDAAEGPVNAVIQGFYAEMAPWWPPERAHVEAGYRTLPFPFEPIDAPVFEMRADWPVARLLGYFGTWSAVIRCRKHTGDDPLDALAGRLAEVWPDPGEHKHIRWPIAMRIGRVG